MPKAKKTTQNTLIPRYYLFRKPFIAGLIYFLLVFPIFMALSFKFLPQFALANIKHMSLIETKSDPTTSSHTGLNKIDFELTDNEDSSRINQNRPEEKGNGILRASITTEDDLDIDSFKSGGIVVTSSLLMMGLLFSSLIFFNYPFKEFFHKKRRKKKISSKLNAYCKKYLLKTPLLNSSILFLLFLCEHCAIAYFIFNIKKDMVRGFGLKFLLISAISSLLVVLFIGFWQKYRVHIKYIDHIYTREELYKGVFRTAIEKISRRMWISTTMTTFFPLAIVILYIFLSFSSFQFDTSQPSLNKNLLMGDFSNLYKRMSEEQMIEQEVEFEQKMINWLSQDKGGFKYLSILDSYVMLIGIGTSILVVFLYIFLFVRWSTAAIVRPVEELLLKMEKTGSGEMNNFSVVRINDEIGRLTSGYNDMTERIGTYIHSISSLSETYYKFVPKQFLQFLDKKDIQDIKLGDQILKKMAVMFCDIRDFTAISESMTPKQNFNFINRYLGFMEPVIRKNNGFTDKYIGDSIMALFPENTEDAVVAAIDMQKKLQEFNVHRLERGEAPIRNGIGINSGNLMLGVVGSEDRLAGTVISDAVNLSFRLEGLTKIYGAKVIISENSLSEIKNPNRFNHRILDIVKVKGKEESIFLFEIIDSESEEQIKLKLKTKDEFERAFGNYQSKDFEKALIRFKKIIMINPQDKAATLYIKRCNTYQKTPPGVDWEGVWVMEHK